MLALPRGYDLVVSDFEPVSAYFARIRGVPSVAVSHQAAVLQSGAPRPARRDRFAEWIMNWYAPCRMAVGIHFRSYAPNIVEPIIRDEVRRAFERYAKHQGDQYVVYLPAFDHGPLVSILSGIKARWVVFSKQHRGPPLTEGPVQVYPTGHPCFEEQLATCRGLVTNAGFETIAEALFMGKKIFAMPMRGQYEQHCNAAAAQLLGVWIGKASFHTLRAELPKWVEGNEAPPRIEYGDPIPDIVERILVASGRSN
jgi:uncharacterized protein (TIGR00661 family)